MIKEPRQKFCGDVGVFYQGTAVVEENGGWFHILEDGTPAYKERYEMAEYFQNGLAWVRRGKIWIRINKQGKEAQKKNTSSVN
jgi:hypothetical protein